MNQTIRIEKCGNRGAIVLDRPRTLNALDLSMVRQLTAALSGFAVDPDVEFVTLGSTEARAFCAGGDLRSVRNALDEGRPADADAFFREEYILNQQIAAYPKPFVSLISGICMGGGLGLSVYGAERIVSNETVMAMPEGRIGFFVDVGASYFLNRLPGSIGMYLALTGSRLTGAEAVSIGLATRLVPQPVLARLNEISTATNTELLSIIGAASQKPEKIALNDASEIDECFAGETIEQIHDNLQACGTSWAISALDELKAASPTSTYTSHALLKAARSLSLKACLDLEFEIAIRTIRSEDFREGTRAILIDKDKNPAWGEVNKTIFDESILAFKRNTRQMIKVASG